MNAPCLYSNAVKNQNHNRESFQSIVLQQMWIKLNFPVTLGMAFIHFFLLFFTNISLLFYELFFTYIFTIFVLLYLPFPKQLNVTNIHRNNAEKLEEFPSTFTIPQEKKIYKKGDYFPLTCRN